MMNGRVLRQGLCRNLLRTGDYSPLTLQVYNEQNKLAQWAQVVSQCRGSGMSVRQWCQENDVNISSYYKWQRKVYAAAQAQQERSFVEVTPVQPAAVSGVAVTLRIAGAELDIHNGADEATVEAVLLAVKAC